MITLYVSKCLEERIHPTCIFLICEYSHSNFLRFYEVIPYIIREIVEIDGTIMCSSQYLNCFLRSYIRLGCFA